MTGRQISEAGMRELLQRRSDLADRAHAIIEIAAREVRALKADDQTAVDAMLAECDELSAEINRRAQ